MLASKCNAAEAQNCPEYQQVTQTEFQSIALNQELNARAKD